MIAETDVMPEIIVCCQIEFPEKTARYHFSIEQKLKENGKFDLMTTGDLIINLFRNPSDASCNTCRYNCFETTNVIKKKGRGKDVHLCFAPFVV